MERDNILIGAGELYITEFTGTEIPEHAEIEVEANNVGACSSGFDVEYKPTINYIKDQYGDVVKSYIESEEITCKTGIMTWKLDNLTNFSSGTIVTDSAKKTLTIGGSKSLKTLLVRFVHTKEDGKKIRFTTIAQAGNGFVVPFQNKEITVDAELKSIKKVSDFICSFEEEIGA